MDISRVWIVRVITLWHKFDNFLMCGVHDTDVIHREENVTNFQQTFLRYTSLMYV